MSAYVSEALAKQVAVDEEPDALLALLDRLDAELGPPTADDYAWALRFAHQQPRQPGRRRSTPVA